jgi:hypothetical protein
MNLDVMEPYFLGQGLLTLSFMATFSGDVLVDGLDMMLMMTTPLPLGDDDDEDMMGGLMTFGDSFWQPKNDGQVGHVSRLYNMYLTVLSKLYVQYVLEITFQNTFKSTFESTFKYILYIRETWIRLNHYFWVPQSLPNVRPWLDYSGILRLSLWCSPPTKRRQVRSILNSIQNES